MSGRRSLYAYTGGMVSLALVAADEWLDLRKWRRVSYQVTQVNGSAVTVSAQARTRPPPIGAMEWPGGRVLLQWALDEGRLGDGNAAASVLEIGSGIGVTAIGLALSRRGDESAREGGESARQGSQPQRRIVATDVCDETLSLLRANVDAHRLGDEQLRVSKWDAAAGEEALKTLPVPLKDLTHVIGSDVVYHGFGTETDASGRGLAKTLAALLKVRPTLSIHLMVIDRFSGGAVAVLSDAAGVNQTSATRSTTVDLAVAQFEQDCDRLDLAIQKQPVPPAVIDSVRRSQWPPSRALAV